MVIYKSKTVTKINLNSVQKHKLKKMIIIKFLKR